MNDSSALPPPSPHHLEVRREPFIFTGTAREYFGIWVVNVLLTILTLGIYSAWAKVRRQRYFYGNTHLAGAAFEYHARPVQILIGRIIVLLLIAAYNLALNFVPVVGGLIAVAAIFAVPWLVCRGLRFSARVTSYRNVRFDHTGTYWGAFQAFILGTALIYGTAGVLAPLASQWMWNYTLGNLRYGDRPVTCDPRLERLYRQWWLPAGVFLGGIVVALIVAVAVIAGGLATGPAILEQLDEHMLLVAVALVYLAIVPIIILYLIVGTLYRAGMRNAAFNETVIDGRHALASSIHRGRYLWIAMSNLVATIATLGLARPWAAIRMASYLASATALDTTGSLDAYFATIKAEGAATGAEFMDIEGFDVGF
jgi:uncharacterized membrane protein YjgN (DUF898 family)